MQKKLIALAVAALATGSAFAQSNVTISGNISGGYSNTKFTGPGTAGYGSENAISDGRLSRIRFTGTEDLGGGLKAEFQAESRFMIDRNDSTAGLGAIGSGDTFVGLNGDWGRVRLGRLDTYYSDGVGIELNRAGSFQSHGLLTIFSQVDGSYAVNPGRANNALRYDTPRMSGFQGTVQYSTNPLGQDGAAAANGAKGAAWYAAGNYLNGPIFAGLSYYQHDPEGGGQTDNKAWRAYGSYTLPFGLKLGLAYDKTRASKGVGLYEERGAWLLPVTYSFGNHSIYASYAKAGRTKNQAGNMADTGATFYNLGYDYALSKRTSVGGNYTKLNNKTNSNNNLFLGAAVTGLGQVQATGNGMDVRQIYIGVNHNF